MKKEPSSFLLLGDRQFLFFFGTVFLSNIGGWIQNVALSWLSLSLKNTPLSFGFISFLGSIPSLFFSTIGGYLADAMDNRKTLIISQTVSLFVAAVIGTLALLKMMNYELLAIFTFISGIASAITYPVYYTLMTGLVEKNKISRVIALNSLQFNLSRFIGPVLFGILVYFVSLSGCFIINALSYMPFLYVVLTIPGLKKQEVKTPSGMIANIRDGLRYVAGNKAILYVVMIIFFYSLLILPFFGMLPYIVKNFLKDDPGILSLIMGAFGVGTLVGAFFIAFYPKDEQGTLKRFFVGGFLFPFALFALAYISGTYYAGAVVFVLGLLMVFFYASGNSYLQMVALPEFRGRVVSFFTSVYLGVYPIGILAMGWSAEHFGLRSVIMIQSGAACLIFITYIFLLYGRQGMEAAS